MNDRQPSQGARNRRSGHSSGVRDAVARRLSRRQTEFAPPGHFYSPIPDLEAVRAAEGRIFGAPPRELPGIDLNEPGQLALLEACERFYGELPFTAEAVPGMRYYFENPFYSYSDAIFLCSLIRHLRPRRIVEVGSGFSSCVTLDVNDLFFDGEISCSFIEPFPDVLRSLLRDDERERIDLRVRNLQEEPLATFASLQAGDILLIDSTHVGKVGSDVNYLLFEILPRLTPGVFVHFHDVFYPFEYPREWIYEGRAWNEAYLLRSFLAFNGGYSIALFTTFLEHFYEQRFAERMPLCLKNRGGSLWLCREEDVARHRRGDSDGRRAQEGDAQRCDEDGPAPKRARREG